MLTFKFEFDVLKSRKN